MRITIIGAGYVGLVSGACFADFGHDVTCVDNNRGRLEQLLAGRMPIYEPGLDELVMHNVSRSRLRFTDDLAGAVSGAEVVFIAVGTPQHGNEGAADISYVHAAARSIGEALSGYTVVVDKSTVPVGTGDAVAAIIRAANPSADFSVVSNPEFLREGTAIEDFMRPDRVVIGADDERSRRVMMDVYRPLSLDKTQILLTDRRTAELTKYAANSFLAMKITFINEMADLCEKLGADVLDVSRGIGLDKRIGASFLNPGPGFGGSCFPKDALALVKTARDAASPVSLVETTVKINDRRKHAMAEKIVAACGGDVRGKTIGVLGLTFKPNTDDMREAPALTIIEALTDSGATVLAYDPVGMEHARKLTDKVRFVDDAYAVAEDAHAVVIVTEWNEFRSLNLKRLGAAMASPLLLDLRNIYRNEDVTSHGLRYYGLGRGARGNEV